MWECPLFRSLFGVKRTCHAAVRKSVYDPKRTSTSLKSLVTVSVRVAFMPQRPIDPFYPLWRVAIANCNTRDGRARGPAFASQTEKGVCYVRREKNLARRDGIVRCDCFGEHACCR